MTDISRTFSKAKAAEGIWNLRGSRCAPTDREYGLGHVQWPSRKGSSAPESAMNLWASKSGISLYLSSQYRDGKAMPVAETPASICGGNGAAAYRLSHGMCVGCS